MSPESHFRNLRTRISLGIGAAIFVAVCAGKLHAFAEDRTSFPQGYDAVQAAPNSHKVIFENTFVRVLQVTLPPIGTTEPMHHHHWPGFFVYWDTGGKSAHIRYHTADSVTDSPSAATAVHPGHWSVEWLKPEPMHAIEVVENADAGGNPPLLRVEIKLPR